MNKSVVVGMVAGVGIATAGGVAAFSMLGNRAPSEQQAVMVEREAAAIEPVAARLAPQPEARPALAVQQAPAPAPRPAAQPAAPKPAAQPARAPAPQPVQVAAVEPPAPEVTENCVEGPKDQHAIAGTALGAVVGGALGKEVGDSDLSTAAGAAAGAFIGRRLQRRMQVNRAEQQAAAATESGCVATEPR
jgi:uncharacterized protein YcfJ